MEVNVDNCLEASAKEIQIKCEEKVNDPESVKKEYQSESLAEKIQIKSEEKDSEVGPEDTDNQTESVTKEDPFAYLDRDDFTSEKYKIEIRNLPRHYGIAVSIFYRTLFLKYE